MAAPKRDNTAQGRFGFADEDLKTPLHDEILMWVDRYAAEIVTQMFSLDTLPKVHVTWEHTIKNEKGFQGGWVDMLIEFQAGRRAHYQVFVEAKTKIPSLGELIRQLRLYQSALPYNCGTIQRSWLVVSPDDRFAPKLRDQQFHFLLYDPAQNFAGIGHK